MRITSFAIIAVAALFLLAGPVWLAIRLTPPELYPTIGAIDQKTLVIPRTYADTMPTDLDMMSIPARKAEFVEALLPLVLRANEQIREDRNRLVRLIDKQNAGAELADWEAAWLAGLAERYRTAPDEPEVLLRRVDIIPPSLALAQGAIESHWGMSRFARQGNALFGKWTWSAQGIIPRGRPEGETYRVKKYDTLFQSVADYLHNLNTHRAYRELRATRAALRESEVPLTGLQLAGTLQRYSERGQAYVKDLRSIIRYNEFSRYNNAVLEPKHGLAGAR